MLVGGTDTGEPHTVVRVPIFGCGLAAALSVQLFNHARTWRPSGTNQAAGGDSATLDPEDAGTLLRDSHLVASAEAKPAA